MNKHYDHYLDLTLDTQIKDEKDGYYAFEDTVFYAEKGGMMSDEGTINNLEVLDLKWEDDVVYHKVDGVLNNPIHMQVDETHRVLNTAVQTAFHILDGYYARLGLYMPSVCVDPKNQWFEVNSKDLDDTHLQEVQSFMNHVLTSDIPVTFSYMAGKDYPDEKYHHFAEVREVKIGELDCQPCGTPHVENTNQIGSFVILGSEKTSRGTRVYVSIGLATNLKVQKEYTILQECKKLLSVKEDEVLDAMNTLLQSNKQYKKRSRQFK